jgi:hypothetical protein
MTEKSQLKEALLKLGLVVIFAILYCLGGFGMLFLRRFVAPIVLGVGLFAITRNWRSLLQGLLLIGTLSLGYGADSVIIKILKRLLFGVANGSTGLVYQKWIVGIVNIILVTGLIVYLGVTNPFFARAEELVIGLIIPLFSVFMCERR